jgi:tetratricopeptide (TPR) repeat protein/predicted Ser/Thr protein kinase
VETIGKYQVLKVLGRGGAGIVYEVTEPALGLKVALKLLSRDARDTPALRARFLREARAAAALGHVNVAQVYEAGEHAGQPFVAMELVPGVDLEQAARSSRPYPVVWVLDVLRQICEGLAHAHRGGLVHRDLKPTDIRVTPEGEVKVLDFGIANLKSFERPDELPALGSLHYRAPEQVEGRRADHRTDVYSVGAILYELLARRKPFPADSPTGVLRRITHESPDPSALPATAFSPRLEALVMKALSRRPEDRFASIAEMREELVALVREAAPRLREGAARGPGPAAAPGEPPSSSAPAEVAAASGDVEEQRTALRADLARARASGAGPQALEICQRLLELDPDDEEARHAASEIETALQENEAEQLCGMALAYAADGDLELATKIAERVERLTPWSPRYLQLQVYLDEESARRNAESFVAAARGHLAEGRLEEAIEVAENVLVTDPTHHGALQVRDRAAEALRARRAASGEDESRRRDAVLAQVESLTSEALDYFVHNDHPAARQAVEDALALDPDNRKARELLKILGALG